MERTRVQPRNSKPTPAVPNSIFPGNEVIQGKGKKENRQILLQPDNFRIVGRKIRSLSFPIFSLELEEGKKRKIRSELHQVSATSNWTGELGMICESSTRQAKLSPSRTGYEWVATLLFSLQVSTLRDRKIFYAIIFYSKQVFGSIQLAHSSYPSRTKEGRGHPRATITCNTVSRVARWSSMGRATFDRKKGYCALWQGRRESRPCLIAASKPSSAHSFEG